LEKIVDIGKATLEIIELVHRSILGTTHMIFIPNADLTEVTKETIAAYIQGWRKRAIERALNKLPMQRKKTGLRQALNQTVSTGN
jgi:hypothetical protein